MSARLYIRTAAHREVVITVTAREEVELGRDTYLEETEVTGAELVDAFVRLQSSDLSQMVQSAFSDLEDVDRPHPVSVTDPSRGSARVLTPRSKKLGEITPPNRPTA